MSRRRRREDRTGARIVRANRAALPRPEELSYQQAVGELERFFPQEEYYGSFNDAPTGAAYVVRQRPREVFPRAALLIGAPGRVKFCIRRKVRREVLFAKGRAGYGGSARKRKWNRTANSQWSC